jgi:putative membrane protein
LVILTLPVTIITLGLFLLIINGLIIVLCTKIVTGFAVHSFFTAFLFSIILSIAQSLFFSVSNKR